MHRLDSNGRHIIRLLAILLGTLAVFRLGMGFALPLLTFAIGLAIVGPSNWLKWVALFSVVAMLTVGAFSLAASILPKDGVWVGLFMFGLIPLLPAFFLWLANVMRRRQHVAHHG